jgi:hypothetical protein
VLGHRGAHGVERALLGLDVGDHRAFKLGGDQVDVGGIARIASSA